MHQHLSLPIVRLFATLIAIAPLSGCDNSVEVSAGKLPADDAPPANPFVEVREEVVTVRAYRVTIRDLLEVIARESGLELVLHQALEEEITIALEALPFVEAIDRILQDRSYTLEHAAGPEGIHSRGTGTGTGVGRLVVPATSDPEIDNASGGLPSPRELEFDARQAIVVALAEDGSAEAIAALATALSDPQWSLREEAVYALADVGGDSAARILQQSLTDPAPEVRRAAIQAYASIGGTASAHALAFVLQDQDPSLRESAVWALGDIGGETAVIYLRRAAGDSDAAVRQAAVQILDEP